MPDGLSLMPLSRAVFGHHGEPVNEASPRPLRGLYGAYGLANATTFAREAVSLVLDGLVAVRRGAQLEHASWIVAGLAVLADWIGSSLDMVRVHEAGARSSCLLADGSRTRAHGRFSFRCHSPFLPTIASPLKPMRQRPLERCRAAARLRQRAPWPSCDERAQDR